jgi:hypothetical protein
MILGIAFILIPLIFLVGKGDGEEKERVIYVGDVVKIQKFDEDGNFLGIIERPRLTKKGNDLDNLRRNIVSDLEVDEEGNLYVITFKGFTLEGVKNEILKFDKDGNFVVRFGEEFLPCEITIDKEGNLFITTDDCQVKKITKDGKFILSFGKKGKDKGEFMLPHGIAVDNDGNVYVTDTHNHRIQKFTKDGEFILAFGGSLGDIHPLNALEWYVKEFLKKDLEDVSPEELDRDLKRIFSIYLMREGKFCASAAIAVNF